jgi:hypothetical protein
VYITLHHKASGDIMNPPWLRPTWMILLAIFALIVISCQDGDSRRFWVKEPFAVRLPFQSERRDPAPPYLFVGKATADKEENKIGRDQKWGELPFGRLAIVGPFIIVDHDLQYAPQAARLAKLDFPKGFSVVNTDPPHGPPVRFDTVEEARGYLMVQGETAEIRFLTYDEWEEIDRPRPPLWKRAVILMVLLPLAVLTAILWPYCRSWWKRMMQWADEPDPPRNSNGILS